MITAASRGYGARRHETKRRLQIAEGAETEYTAEYTVGLMGNHSAAMASKLLP